MFKKLKNKLKNWTKKVSTEPPKEKNGKEIRETKPKKDKSEKQKETQKKTRKQTKEKKKKQTKEPQKIKKKPEEKENKPKKENKNWFKKKNQITEKNFENYKEELEILLLENNVALEVTDSIIKKLKEEIVGKEFEKKNLEQEISKTLKKIIKDILLEPEDIIKKIKEKKEPYIILFCGINGVGKTTTIAKFVNLLKKEKISSVIAAGDTFRAASIEQLKKHGENLNTKIIASDYGADPASVGFDAIKYAKKNNIGCVLIDTAGRMHTDKNLISQLQKISRVCDPDSKLFIGESITGNDMLEQAKTFNEAIEIDGIILCKADIDEKGGTALSVGEITKKPILFLGTGQKYQDLERFNKDKFVELLGL
jgi:fused signal recognition particle receptor